ncbi:MAG TPA: ankyrin repeat domain-containing protein [Pseudoxanthomonas sp.]|jgi:ankyrin repeat protein|nr:ankyrin repeat domain-containing protein [Pseudoxanthomonas sp.]
MRWLLLLSLWMQAAGLCAAEATPSADAQAAAARAQLRSTYFDAARQGRSDIMKEFIAARWDLELQDSKGYTALILAAYHGHAALVSQLLAAGANPCHSDLRGNTALMGAIFKGELSVAKQLLDAPCAVDQRNHAGQTAAMYAALFRRKAILEALTAKGADMQAQDARGNTAERLQRGEFASP